MTDRELMQMALDALEAVIADVKTTPNAYEAQRQAIEALRARLAQPEPEHATDGTPCWCNPEIIEEDGSNVIVHNYDDNWQQYSKPGETAQQCIERHRAEQDALLELLKELKMKEKNA